MEMIFYLVAILCRFLSASLSLTTSGLTLHIISHCRFLSNCNRNRASGSTGHVRHTSCLTIRGRALISPPVHYGKPQGAPTWERNENPQVTSQEKVFYIGRYLISSCAGFFLFLLLGGVMNLLWVGRGMS